MEFLSFQGAPRTVFSGCREPDAGHQRHPRVIRNQPRVFRNDNRVFRNARAGYQERKLSGFQEPALRVFRNQVAKKPLPHQHYFTQTRTVTRARDLNSNINSVTTTTPPLRGLRPLPAQTCPTPTHPIRSAYGDLKIQPIPRRPSGREKERWIVLAVTPGL